MLADILSTVFERRFRIGRPAEDDSRSTGELVTALVGAAGEVSGRVLAWKILDRYAAMDDEGKISFFDLLTGDMSIDPTRVRETLSAYEANPGGATYRALMDAVEPKRQELIRRLNMVPNATGRLVKMRADLLRLSKGDPALAALDLDFRHLFASWFNRGFLVLRPINWESPAHILEKIIAYEAVHAIDSWDDLRRRLEPADRRCFAFFHPAMPDEPLIFVEVALTVGTPGSVQDLLSEGRVEIVADEADTAVFYSISNCQAGLAGISFGNSLIKQVATDLSLELPTLKTFVTLSPIPALNDWIRRKKLQPDLRDDERVRELAAYYLVSAKRTDGLPFDPVARFHLGNGARVHKVHAGADTSAKGRRQSNGAMVNYLYDLDQVTSNHEQYAATHQVISSPEVRSLNQSAERTILSEATR